ncbi:hypothetical protein [Dickeya solani]|uniref:Uncharacterized protein n=1 Tax=Dickeya solani TaxID=1089444 RepID=A0AAX4F6W5_9GAMM|nr:hypothetical protein [Dickeya solani]MBJ2352058.1 hypothetical protein [Dickeya solani]MCZ0821293.1 hypothetical protein [Dickeya solani]WOA55080.1 hypothetical protein RXA29_01150 [Dickeya solani]
MDDVLRRAIDGKALSLAADHAYDVVFSASSFFQSVDEPRHREFRFFQPD